MIKNKIVTTQKELNTLLIEHYNCFNTERFFLDEFDNDKHFVSVQTSSMQDTCPVNLCRGIARFIKKHIQHENFKFIYVAAYIFHTDKL